MPVPLHPSTGAVLCVGIDMQGQPERWREAAAPLASPGERRRAGRFVRAMDAAGHLAGRALARRLLAGQGCAITVGDEFTEGPHGQPRWPGGPAFSISHAGDAVWVALCSGAPVGIDVEPAGRAVDPADLLPLLHPAERQDLGRLDGESLRAALLRCWTRKEAVAKATGLGLHLRLDAFRVAVDARAAGWLLAPPGAGDWTCADLDAGARWQVSVAAAGAGLRVAVAPPGLRPIP